MNAIGKVMAVGGVGAAAAIGRRLAGRHRESERSRDQHWLAVTVNRPLEDVDRPEAVPEPLRRLGERVELRFGAAPGGKGTEVLAHPTEDGGVSREELRVALRQAKALLETGIVLEPDSAPSTHPGPAGKVLQYVTRKSKGEGRL